MRSGIARRIGRAGVGVALALGVLATAVPAYATGSVVATDRQTKEVGGALATCIMFDNATNVQNGAYTAVPGVGVVHGQAFYFNNKKQGMANQLAQGRTPSQIIKDMIVLNMIHPEWATADAVPTPRLRSVFADLKDPIFNRRQYLVASTKHAGNAWTGDDESVIGVPLESGSSSVAVGRFRGVAAGNTLTHSGIFSEMERAFERASVVATLEEVLGRDIPAHEEALVARGDLADRLFVTLAATFRPAADGTWRGDWRCTESDNPRSSSLAYLRVDAADGTTPINLRWSSRNPQGADAVSELAELFYACRVGTGACDTAVVAP